MTQPNNPLPSELRELLIEGYGFNPNDLVFMKLASELDLFFETEYLRLLDRLETDIDSMQPDPDYYKQAIKAERANLKQLSEGDK